MAFDLGWHHENGSSLDHDYDAIQVFIQQLDKEMNVVMISEYMQESLLMLLAALPHLSPHELILHDQNRNRKKKIVPNASELEELSEFLYVDQLIYDHFKKKLLKWWQHHQTSDKIVKVRHQLECLQQHSTHKWSSDKYYSKLLWKKQKARYGEGCSTDADR